MPKFVINDESVENSHGFYLINSGANLERYKANPVVLYDHNTSLPIAVGTELAVEGSTMTFIPDFDEDDELAIKLSKKVEKGHLKGCSPGIIVLKFEIETVGDRDVCRVTEWELCEISIVTVPSNRNAIKMYNTRMEELTIDDLKLMAGSGQDSKNNNNKNKMDKITLTPEAMTALGITSTDTADISADVIALAAKAKQLEDAITAINLAKAETLVLTAITTGKITADKKECFLELAKTNFDLAKSTLDAIPEKSKMGDKIVNPGGAPTGLAAKTWDELDRAGKLVELLSTDPDAYKDKFREKFGTDPLSN